MLLSLAPRISLRGQNTFVPRQLVCLYRTTSGMPKATDYLQLRLSKLLGY